MWDQDDYLQVVGEIKERNCSFKALNETKEIALSNNSKNMQSELEEQFKLIAQKVMMLLKTDTSRNK